MDQVRIKARLYEIEKETPRVLEKLKRRLRELEASVKACRWEEDLSMLYRLERELPRVKFLVEKILELRNLYLEMAREKNELEKALFEEVSDGRG